MKTRKPFLNCHSLLPLSRANGPGLRFVIWTQGCSRCCQGCFNPATHPHEPHQLLSIEALFKQILTEGARIEGISVSGGEPLEQAEAVCQLLSRIRQETTLSTLLFTGFTYEELLSDPGKAKVLELLDILVAGPYIESQRQSASLTGSANQQLYLLTDRYTQDQLDQVPPAEVHVTADGQIIFSGIRPQQLPK